MRNQQYARLAAAKLYRAISTAGYRDCRALHFFPVRLYFTSMVCAISQPTGLRLRRQGESKKVLGGTFSVASGRRSYSPGLGRWVNRDPIGEVGGNNLILIVDNRPTFRIDKLGMLGLTTPIPIMPFPVPSPPPEPSPSSPFLAWTNEKKMDISEGKKMLCVLKKLGVDTPFGSPLSNTFYALETLFEQKKVWSGDEQFPIWDVYGQAKNGEIIVQNGIGFINVVATLMHETVHVLLENGLAEDFPGADPAGAMEDGITSLLENADRPVTWQKICCRRSNGTAFVINWTLLDRLRAECEYPDVCAQQGATLVGKEE